MSEPRPFKLSQYLSKIQSFLLPVAYKPSQIQGVIAQVILKSDKREADLKWFFSWIVRSQSAITWLLINRIYNKVRNWNIFREFRLSENAWSAFHKFWKLWETSRRKPLAECNWRPNYVVIQLQKLQIKLDTCYKIPSWLYADYVTDKLAENQSRSRILLQYSYREWACPI